MGNTAAGHGVMPRRIPNNVVATMPIRIAPVIFRAIKISMIASPTHASLRSLDRKTSQADERRRIRHHQLRVAQSDERDEHPNSAGG